MRNECSIIRDLLPLCIEGMAGADSQEFVEEHLRHCEACRAEAEIMRSRPLPEPAAGAPLGGMQRWLRGKYLRIAAITASLVLALAVALFAQLTRPIYLDSDDAVASVSAVDTGYNGKIGPGGQFVLNFTDKVARYSCHEVTDPYTHTVEYTVTAWTSAWDRLFSTAGPARLVLYYDGRPTAFYYCANDNEADVLLHAESYEPSGGRVALPRLALAYYLIGAAGLAVLLTLLRLVFRRFPFVRRTLDVLWPMPAAYLLGHLAVLGANTLSYDMTRDLIMTLLAALPFYCALLSLRSLLRMYLQRRQDLAQ